MGESGRARPNEQTGCVPLGGGWWWALFGGGGISLEVGAFCGKYPKVVNNPKVRAPDWAKVGVPYQSDQRFHTA